MTDTPKLGEVLHLRKTARRMTLGDEMLGTSAGWTRADQHGRQGAFDICLDCARAGPQGECSVWMNIEHLKQYGFRPVMWECAQFIGLPPPDKEYA